MANSLRNRLMVLAAGAVFAVVGLTGCPGEEEPETDPDAGVEDVDTDEGPDADTGDAQTGDADAGDADADADQPAECPLEIGGDGPVRTFVFGSKIQMDAAESYDTYEAYFRGQVEEIAPCLREDGSDVLMFPEDAGLHAGLIGSRGDEAREASSANEAFLNLMVAYEDPIDEVDDRWDDLATPRRILLGLTDTLWRAMDHTFGGIAEDYGAWVVTSGNVAEIDERTDDEAIEVWADPDLDGVDTVYVPAGRHVYNSAIVYAPDGELVDRLHKPFLTSTEEEELALSYGSVEDVRPLEVAGVEMGFFTSKDAWMPPMNDRLGLLGTQIQVQPEAFSGWTITHLEDQQEWLPDVITQSGWAAVQKYPSLTYGAMPVLTGNFVGMVFDGQPVVWGQAHPGVEFGGFVGQKKRPGFLAVGDWAFDDPVEDDSEMSLEERRSELRDLGEAMLPGAGEPHENAYVDGVVAWNAGDMVDYEVDDPTEPNGAVETTRHVEPTDGDVAFPQRVRLDAEGDFLSITWQDHKEKTAPTVVKQWNEQEAHYEPAGEQAQPIADEDRVVAPDVAMAESGETLTVAQIVGEDSEIPTVKHDTVDSASSNDYPGPSVDGSRDMWLPSIARDDDRVALAYTDRATGHDRVYVAMSDEGAATFGEPVEVAGPAGVEPPNTRGMQWHPAVDVRGDTVVVVWTDFRDFQWDLYATYSLDGGETFEEPRRIDGAGDGYERLHTDPRVVLDGDDEAIVSWTFQSDRRPDTDAVYRRWNLDEDELGDAVVLDSAPETYPTQAWLPRVIPADDGVAAVWMEMVDDAPYIALKLPGGDVHVASRGDTLASWPDLVVTDRAVVAAWVEYLPQEGYSVRIAEVER